MTISDPYGYILLTGLVTLALLFLNALLRIWRQSPPRVGWFGGLLALVSAIALLASTLLHTFVQSAVTSPVVIITAVSFGGLVLGLVLLVIERRRESFSAPYSHSLLFLAVVILTGVQALLIPILPSQFWPQEVQKPVVAETTITPTVRSATATLRPTVMPTLVPSSTATLEPTAPPTPTATREPFSTRTPTPTATITAICGAVVNFNLNLRTMPTPDSDVLAVIPYTSIIAVGGKSSDSEWWFVEYNDQWGWVQQEFVSAEGRCATAPNIQ